MPLFVLFLITSVASIAMELIRKPAQGPKPAAFDDFTVPTADANRPIPVAFGTVRQTGPNLIWDGDYRTDPIKKKVSIFLFIKKSVVTGYRYSIGLAFALTYGQVDYVKTLLWDEKVSWSGTVASGTFTEDAPQLFGGEDSEGGVHATCDLLNGSDTQAANSYLTTQSSLGIAYRGVSVLVRRGPSGARGSGYVGTQPSLHQFAVEFKRIPNHLGLAGGKQEINGDANIAEVIYEIMTNDRWGLGLSPAFINTASFVAVANTLYSEGLGVSFIWDQTQAIDAVISELLKLASGLIYVDWSTGLFTLKLARNDYSIPSLLVFDDTNIIDIKNYSRGSYDETTNELSTTYTDRNNNFNAIPITTTNLANVMTQQGDIVASNINYVGISNADTALKVLNRDLKSVSLPLAKGTFAFNRQASTLRPGDCFVWNWPPYGVSGVVMRVMKVNPGGLTNGQIEMDCIEDVFALGNAIYTTTATSQWTEPISNPSAVTNHIVGEQPYYFAGDRAKPWIIVEEPNGAHNSFDVYLSSTTGGPYTLRDSKCDYAPTATLVGTVSAIASDYDTTGFTITAGPGCSIMDPKNASEIAKGQNLFMWGNEISAFESLTDNGDGTLTLTGVWRGLLDTTPEDHTAGQKIYFFSYGQSQPGDTYPTGTTIFCKEVTTTQRGELNLASATQFTITFSGRSKKPYPPAFVTINGSYTTSGASGDITVAWRHRDRTQQIDVLKQSGVSVGPERGVTYKVEVYGQTGTLLRTATGITGTSYVYTEAQELTDNAGVLNSTLTFKVYAVKGAQISNPFVRKVTPRTA